MKDLDDRDRLESEGERHGEGPPVSGYDPLLSPWEALSQEALELDDPLGAAGSPFAPSDAFTWHDSADGLTWDSPPPAVGPSIRPSQLRPSSWYATGWGQSFSPPLTDAQRRLRAGVLTIPKPERRWTVTARELAETLLLALLIFLAVRASFQNFRVEGASMHPSLENGEYLIVNKLSYAEIDLSLFNFLPFFDAGDNPVRHLWDKPSRGDVVVFQSPTSANRDFIKRIIGVPGDTITVDPGGQVTANGKALDEPYVSGRTYCNSSDCTWHIPESGSIEALEQCGAENCYFVMGDNRQNSSDSRQGWLVPEQNIVGKALVSYWRNGGPDLHFAPNHNVAAGDN
jgi:signal peptidase I